MSPFDPKKPPKPSNPQTLTTSTGVKVTVNHAPPPQPKPKREPEVAEASPRVAIRPPERPAQEGARDAFVREIVRKHSRLVHNTLRAQGDFNEESTKDLAQQVFVIAGKEFDKHGPPKNEEGWLVTIARNEGRNHRGKWKPKVKEGADVDEAFANTPDPEGAAELAEHRAKVMHHCERLTQAEKEVVLCADVYGMTIPEIVVAVGRCEGTVASQLARGRAKLEEFVKESERATAAGERRKPGR